MEILLDSNSFYRKIKKKVKIRDKMVSWEAAMNTIDWETI